ncbi:hypothetical protein G5V59_04825 [Nocardioides sp. W3-2-3]|nr:hypothetical protein [Nocardioides convexus]
MPTVERTITVPKPVSVVWDYLSDFTNTEEWDPPTVSTTRTSGDGGVGTTYKNVSSMLGHETEVDYEVVRFEPEQVFEPDRERQRPEPARHDHLRVRPGHHHGDLPQRVLPARRRQARHSGDRRWHRGPRLEGGRQPGEAPARALGEPRRQPGRDHVRDRLDGDHRVDAGGGGEAGRVGDVQAGDVPGLAVRVDGGGRGRSAHPGAAHDVQCRERHRRRCGARRPQVGLEALDRADPAGLVG